MFPTSLRHYAGAVKTPAQKRQRQVLRVADHCKLIARLRIAFRKNKNWVGNRWRLDETYIKIKGEWKYLYRAVDKQGNTIDFLLTARRNKSSLPAWEQFYVAPPENSIVLNLLTIPHSVRY